MPDVTEIGLNLAHMIGMEKHTEKAIEVLTKGNEEMRLMVDVIRDELGKDDDVLVIILLIINSYFFAFNLPTLHYVFRMIRAQCI